MILFTLASCGRHSFTRYDEPNKIINSINNPDFNKTSICMFVPIPTSESSISLLNLKPFKYEQLYFTDCNTAIYSDHDTDIYSYFDNDITDYLYSLIVDKDSKTTAIQKNNTKGQLLCTWEIQPVEVDFFTVFDRNTVVLAIDGVIFKYHYDTRTIEKIFKSSEYITDVYFNKQKNSIYIVTIADKVVSKGEFAQVVDMESSTRVIEYDLNSKKKLSDIAGLNDFYFSNRFNKKIILVKERSRNFTLHVISENDKIVAKNVVKARYIPIDDNLYFINERYAITFALFPYNRTELALFLINENKKLQLCDLMSY